MTRYLLLALVLQSVNPFSAFADTDSSKKSEIKYYDVEVIVFKNISVPRSQEINLPTPVATRTENTLDLSDRASVKKAAESGFTPLTADELRLKDNVRRLIKSSRYELLLHTGWRQPGLDESKSIPVWVKGGKIFDSSYSSIDQMSSLNGSASAARNPSRGGHGGASAGMRGLYELEGQITIILSRYLHTRTELVLRKPADVKRMLQQDELLEGSDEQDLLLLQGQLLLNYGLNEQRRMRSKKLHYLDHPQFGMLVLITPYETIDEVAPEPQDSETPAKAAGLDQ